MAAPAGAATATPGVIEGEKRLRRVVPFIVAGALFLAAALGAVVATGGGVHGPARTAAAAAHGTTHHAVLDATTVYDLPSGSTLTVDSNSITLYLSPETVNEINDLAAAGSTIASAVGQICTAADKLFPTGDTGASAALAICAIVADGSSAAITVFDDLFKFVEASNGSVTFNITVDPTEDVVSFPGTPVGVAIPTVSVPPSILSLIPSIGIPGTPIGI